MNDRFWFSKRHCFRKPPAPSIAALRIVALVCLLVIPKALGASSAIDTPAGERGAYRFHSSADFVDAGETYSLSADSTMATDTDTLTFGSGSTLAGAGTLEGSVILDPGSSIVVGDGVSDLEVDGDNGVVWYSGATWYASVSANGQDASVLTIANGPLTVLGTGGYVIDFQGAGSAGSSMTLATFQGTNLQANKLSASNLPDGLVAAFSVTQTHLSVVLSLDPNALASARVKAGSTPLRAAADAGPPVITSPATAYATVRLGFNYAVTATNSPTSYALVGTLPAGLGFDPQKGIIFGTPMPNVASGASSILTNLVLYATNASGTGSMTLSLNLSTNLVLLSAYPAPRLDGGSAVVGTAGQAFDYWAGGLNYTQTYAVSGTLPPGLTLNPASGELSGTPTQTGSWPVVVTASASGQQVSQTVTITITSSAISFSTTSAQVSGTVGQPLSYTPQFSGTPSGWLVVGTIPAGLSFNTSTGQLTGTPTTATTSTLTLVAESPQGGVSQSLAVSVASAPATPAGSSGGGGGGGAPSTYFLVALSALALVRNYRSHCRPVVEAE